MSNVSKATSEIILSLIISLYIHILIFIETGIYTSYFRSIYFHLSNEFPVARAINCPGEFMNIHFDSIREHNSCGGLQRKQKPMNLIQLRFLYGNLHRMSVWHSWYSHLHPRNGVRLMEIQGTSHTHDVVHIARENRLGFAFQILLIDLFVDYAAFWPCTMLQMIAVSWTWTSYESPRKSFQFSWKRWTLKVCRRCRRSIQLSRLCQR